MSFKNTAVAIVLVAVTSTPAFAQDNNEELKAAIDEAVTGTDAQINVVVEEGVVTLSGLASTLDGEAAEQAAKDFPGVTEVINLVTESSS